MPIIKSAKKALRQSKTRQSYNNRRRRALKETSKKVVDAVTLAAAYQAIDKAAKRGVIKARTAARKKSRLAKSLATPK